MPVLRIGERRCQDRTEGGTCRVGEPGGRMSVPVVGDLKRRGALERQIKCFSGSDCRYGERQKSDLIDGEVDNDLPVDGGKVEEGDGRRRSSRGGSRWCWDGTQ